MMLVHAWALLKTMKNPYSSSSNTKKNYHLGWAGCHPKAGCSWFLNNIQTFLYVDLWWAWWKTLALNSPVCLSVCNVLATLHKVHWSSFKSLKSSSPIKNGAINKTGHTLNLVCKNTNFHLSHKKNFLCISFPIWSTKLSF